MNHIAADVNGQVSTDGAGIGLQGFCRSDHQTGRRNHALPFPHHGHHRTAGDEIHQASKKRSFPVHPVMGFRQLSAGDELLQTDKLEALALKTSEDFSNQTALNTIGLDGDEGALSGHDGKEGKAQPSWILEWLLGKGWWASLVPP